MKKFSLFISNTQICYGKTEFKNTDPQAARRSPPHFARAFRKKHETAQRNRVEEG